jgi:hypothetical protein
MRNTPYQIPNRHEACSMQRAIDTTYNGSGSKRECNAVLGSGPRHCRSTCRRAADDRVSPLVHSLHSLPPLSAVPALALSPAIARPLSYVRAGTDGAPTHRT